MPPHQGLRLDVDAISGICGSISIACWVVVFSPQIIENFRRRSAEGLSLLFIIVWLLGDVFNILGADLQGVLPTMIILAVYYTLADIILLVQCLYYRRQAAAESPKPSDTHTEHSPLLRSHSHHSVIHDFAATHDFTHLSPSMPMTHPAPPEPKPQPPSVLQTTFQNLTAILLVCASGVFGWWISSRSSSHHSHFDDGQPAPESDHPSFNTLGQIFGYLCAALYLGSRVPQILLNARRKSTEGVSLLFFLFACIGNLTYVLSILAFEPRCADPRGTCREGEARAIYARYVLVNLSWLLGSLGTLFEDLVIFAQFFAYRDNAAPQPQLANGNADGVVNGTATPAAGNE